MAPSNAVDLHALPEHGFRFPNWPLYESHENRQREHDVHPTLSQLNQGGRMRCPLTPDLPDDLRLSIGPLFDQLPYELRRTILEKAFGNLKLHIFLDDGSPTNHAARFGHRENKRSAPAVKRWRHCPCSSGTSGASFTPLWLDNCWSRRALNLGADQSLGVMGWLLACRQAYVVAVIHRRDTRALLD